MKKIARLFCSVAWLGLAALQVHAQEIQLIVRGDDFGMTEGSLEAVEQGMNRGMLTSTSIIVPAPWFEGAAMLARRNPGWCTGIHLALVGEWRGYRWRPVLPWDKVASLVDADGFLYTSPKELFSHHPKLTEIDAELRAQVELARRKGVNVQYLDVHYIDFANVPDLAAVIRKIARDYSLPLSTEAGEKEMPNVYTVAVGQKKEQALRRLQDLGPGLWLWVCHVGIDSPEQRALIHTAPEDIFVNGGVGANRADELNVVTSIEVRSLILQRGIRLLNYRELWAQRGAAAPH